MFTTLSAYLLVFLYLASDTRFRSGAKARSFSADSGDRKSTRYIGLAIAVSILALLLSLPLNWLGVGRLTASPGLGWAGVILMALGIGLRAWSTRVLGRFYTRTLRADADQTIVQAGPYRWVRHPGYAGSLLVWVGAGLATLNGIVLAVIVLTVGLGYLYRMHTEETLLCARFGPEYVEYMHHTRRLIPFIY